MHAGTLSWHGLALCVFHSQRYRMEGRCAYAIFSGRLLPSTHSAIRVSRRAHPTNGLLLLFLNTIKAHCRREGSWTTAQPAFHIRRLKRTEGTINSYYRCSTRHRLEIRTGVYLIHTTHLTRARLLPPFCHPLRTFPPPFTLDDMGRMVRTERAPGPIGTMDWARRRLE